MHEDPIRVRGPRIMLATYGDTSSCVQVSAYGPTRCIAYVYEISQPRTPASGRIVTNMGRTALDDCSDERGFMQANARRNLRAETGARLARATFCADGQIETQGA